MKDPLYDQTPIAKRIGKGIDVTLYPLPFKQGGKLPKGADGMAFTNPRTQGVSVPKDEAQARRMNMPWTPGMAASWVPVSKESGKTTYENLGFGRSHSGRSLESPFTRDDYNKLMTEGEGAHVSRANRDIFKRNKNVESIQEGDIQRDASHPTGSVNLKDEVSFITMKDINEPLTEIPKPSPYLARPKMGATNRQVGWGNPDKYSVQERAIINKDALAKNTALNKQTDFRNKLSADAFDKTVSSNKFITENKTPFSYKLKTK